MAQEKFILDATAGFRMMWFNKQHPNAIYLDQRPECEPDIIGDFRDLSMFPDETFRLIIFDPPHIIHKKTIFNCSIVRRFGVLQADTYQADLKKAFKELWRVLKPYGLLLFKWCNQYVSSNEIIALAPEPPLIYQISASTNKVNRKRQEQVKTLWFCFMKIPKDSKES